MKPDANQHHHKRNPFLWTVIGSATLHAVLWTLIAFMDPPATPQIETIEMEVISAPTAESAPKQAETPVVANRVKKVIQIDEKQVVDQDDNKINDEVDENTRFLGKHNQKVIKQSIAPNIGEYKNVSENTGEAAPKLKLQPKFDLTRNIQERDNRERAIEEATEVTVPNVQLETETIRKPAEEKVTKKSPKEGRGTGGDRSQSLDYIKDLEPGLETALSTKEFVFHGYFSRIRRQLEQHWGPNIRRKVTEMHRKGRSIASTDDKVTKCLVTLDTKGNIIKIQVIGDSGLFELDEAAVEAFRSAAPFPNPPRGMVDSDGTIKIRWDFILEA